MQGSSCGLDGSVGEEGKERPGLQVQDCLARLALISSIAILKRHFSALEACSLKMIHGVVWCDTMDLLYHWFLGLLKSKTLDEIIILQPYSQPPLRGLSLEFVSIRDGGAYVIGYCGFCGGRGVPLSCRGARLLLLPPPWRRTQWDAEGSQQRGR